MDDSDDDDEEVDGPVRRPSSASAAFDKVRFVQRSFSCLNLCVQKGPANEGKRKRRNAQPFAKRSTSKQGTDAAQDVGAFGTVANLLIKLHAERKLLLLPDELNVFRSIAEDFRSQVNEDVMGMRDLQSQLNLAHLLLHDLVHRGEQGG